MPTKNQEPAAITTPQTNVPAIRRYYDENTSLFLRFARSPMQTIHRAVWAQGVNTMARAMNYSNELVFAEIARHIAQHQIKQIRIADLGCGVGASAFYIVPRLDIPAHVLGATISGVQARIAHENARRLDLDRACWFVQGDFLAPPVASGFDIAYSIEAFCHATAPDLYFASVAELLARGGKLIVCDDFLAPRETRSADELRWLETYQRGWHVLNLRLPSIIQAIAGEYNLHLTTDLNLTPHLRLRALPDFIACALRAFGERIPARHAIVPSMIGSMALQQCLKLGLVEYRFLVFEKL